MSSFFVFVFFVLKFQTKGSSTNAALATYVQYGKHYITDQKKNMATIYIVYLVNKTKKTHHQCMLNNMLKGFWKAVIDLFLNAISFCILNFSFRSMKKLSKESFSSCRLLQYKDQLPTSVPTPSPPTFSKPTWRRIYSIAR